MSILDYRPQELIAQRKIVSDFKSDTEDLTFSNSSKASSHGEAAASVRDKICVLEIEALERETDKDYYNDLLEE